MAASDMLANLYQARFDELKALAAEHNLPKTGPVESLRARLIRSLVLYDWDLSTAGMRTIPNNDLGELLGLFGIKKSGSIKARRQRLYLHLNHDPKSLTTDNLDQMTRDDLHALCKDLELPLSGNKQSLLARVAGVLASQENAWGKVKKSLRRPKGPVVVPQPTALASATSPAEPEQREAALWEEPLEGVAQELESHEPFLESLSSVEEAAETPIPPMIQHMDEGEIYSLEIENALLEVDERVAEVQAFARDFLTVSSTTNQDDMNAFIASLRDKGFATDYPPVHQKIANIVMELDYRTQNEAVAATALPQSWSEREALRLFEEVRPVLRDQLENLLALHKADVVKARVAFEKEGSAMGLDLRVPSVSGRLHALFDLHVEIAASQALHDPVVLRRQRMLRILHRGAVHMTESEKQTVNRLERNLAAFEELVQTVLDSSENGFEEPQQALVVRFLESKGYEVNTSNLRPRVLACAGILGAELGYLSPAEIPKIAPGVLVSETEVDAIVTELRALAASFKPQNEQIEEEEFVVAESVAEASQNVQRVRSNIDKIDDLLNRLNG
jgi:hypothetical protein